MRFWGTFNILVLTGRLGIAMRGIGFFIVSLIAVAFAGCASSQKSGAAAGPKRACAEVQGDAKAGLTALKAAMDKVKATTGEFPAELSALEANGFKPATETYNYQITKITPDGFSAMASGEAEMTGDMWIVDQTGEVKAYYDKCVTEAPAAAPEATPAPSKT